MDSSGDNLEVLYENYSTPKRSKEKVSASKLFKNVDFTLLEVIIVILYFPKKKQEDNMKIYFLLS